MEQKIKQSGINIGANIRQIRLEKRIKQTELVRMIQLCDISMTREALVKIERGFSILQDLSFEGFGTVWTRLMRNC